MDQHDAQKREIAGVFSRSAPIYDTVGPRFFSHFGRRLVEAASIAPDARVLDVAAGTGAILYPAAQAVGMGGHVTAIDLAGGMVERLSMSVIGMGLTNVEVRGMDAETLRFPDASFDALLCGFAVFFFPQPERALGEFRRVVKPGGKIAISTWATGDERWKWMDEVGEKYFPPPQNDTPPKFSFRTPDGMRAYFSAGGFEDVEVIEDSMEFHYKSADEWLDVMWSHGARQMLEKLSPPALEAWKAEVFPRVEAMRESEGIPQRYTALYTIARRSPLQTP